MSSSEMSTRPSRRGSPRILIVRPTALGDVSRTVPCLVALRRRYPQAKIDWLVSSAFADVIGYHPDLDDVILFDRQGLAKFGRSCTATRQGFALLNRLRKQRYEMVYDLQGLLRSGMFTFATRAPRRIGFADAREGAARLYTHRHRVDPEQHTVDCMMQLLAADGLLEANEPPDLQLYLGDADQTWHERWLALNNLPARGYACLAPTAQWGCKCWPIEFFAQVAARLLRGTEQTPAMAKLVLLAAGHERLHVARLYDLLTQEHGFKEDELAERLRFPMTSVGQLAALIAGTALLVCNDSAALHIAVGFDRPFVAIHGPTDPARVGPYRNRQWVVQPQRIQADEMSQYRRLHDDDTLIRRVDVEQVWQTVVSALQTN